MGKKKKTTVVHNPGYNDRWIRDRFASDASTYNKQRDQLRADDQAIRDDVNRTQNMVGGLRSDVYRDLESGFSTSQKDREKLWQSLTDLSQKEVQWGDVQGLDEQLQGIMGDAQSADDVLRGLIEEQGDQMGYNLQALQQGLSGEFDLGISNLEKSMGKQYTQTQSDITGLGERLQDDLTSKYSELGSRLGKGLSGLESTFTEDIGNVRTALGQGLTELTGQNVELGEDLSGVKDAFKGYREKTQGQFRDVDTQFKAYQDDLLREGQRTDAQISDVYKTREDTVAGLNKAWGDQLQTQENVLSGRIAEGRAAMDKRLSDIATTMNYRTLGDSALGIRSRRSKAFKSGASATGTGQLARGSTVNTLNIA